MDKRLQCFYVFRAAIEDEKKAQRRYSEAIKLIQDRPELVRVFTEILKEEKEHEKRIVQVYERFKKEMQCEMNMSEMDLDLDLDLDLDSFADDE